jgi:hypothetical protein
MRIYFPTSGIINAAAKRLRGYTKQNSAFKKIGIDSALNLVSQCYGYQSYKDFLSNCSSQEPQLKSLSQEQINNLKSEQIKCLSSYFNVLEKEANLLWMIITPAIQSPRNLKLNQIGYKFFYWGRPDEYEEDTTNLKVYSFVIGKECPRCNGIGKYESYEEQYDMAQPPEIFYGLCDGCDGTGVCHYLDETLNKLRLSEEQRQLNVEYNEYYKYYNSFELGSSQESVGYSEYNYDEDNPNPYVDWIEDENEDEDKTDYE